MTHADFQEQCRAPMGELLPCPFCGGKPSIGGRIDEYGSWKTIFCCSVNVSKDSLERAAIAWNTRAPAARASEWQPIDDNTPKDQRIMAAIWHAGEYQIVIAGYAKAWGSWHDEREGSCVGWTPNSKKPGYWKPLDEPPKVTHD